MLRVAPGRGAVFGDGGLARELVALSRGAIMISRDGEEEAVRSVALGPAVIGVGDPQVRWQIAQRWPDVAWRKAPLVHPTASYDEVVTGVGVILQAGVRVTVNVTLHDHVLLNLNVTVGHDVAIGACSVVGHDVIGACSVVLPGANIAGRVRIGERVLVGAGASVRQGVSIGDDAIVGMGAVVLRDVPAGETWVGNPARRLR